jgi:hypothetical protein
MLYIREQHDLYYCLALGTSNRVYSFHRIILKAFFKISESASSYSYVKDSPNEIMLAGINT